MRSAAVIIAVSMLISRVLGVAREVLLARMAGIGPEKNALDLAFLIPDLLNHVISTGFLSIIFIPIFTGYLVKNDSEKAWKFFANILNTLGVFMLLLVIPAWIWMREALLFFSVADPDPVVLERAVYFGRIILPAQIAFLAGSFLVALQHTRKQFLIPALTGLIYNSAIILGGVLLSGNGIAGFAWGVPVGAFVGFLFLQLYGASKGGIQWSPILHLKDPDLRRYLALMLPLMLGVGAMFAMEFVIRSFGSNFGNQGISSLNYAYRIMYTLVAVFGFSVGVAGYPDMSRLAKEGNFAELNGKVMLSLDRMFAILIPAMAAVWVLAVPITRILFERGAFDAQATAQVSSLLRWYLPAAIGLCAQAVLVRSFYAQERMWLPTIINSILFGISLLFYEITKGMGVISVPLVGSITALIQIIVLYIFWKRSIAQKVDSQSKPITHFMSAFATLALLALIGFYTEPFWSFWISNLSILPSLAVCFVVGSSIFILALVIQIIFGNTSAKELFFERILRRKNLH